MKTGLNRGLEQNVNRPPETAKILGYGFLFAEALKTARELLKNLFRLLRWSKDRHVCFSALAYKDFALAERKTQLSKPLHFFLIPLQVLITSRTRWWGTVQLSLAACLEERTCALRSGANFVCDREWIQGDHGAKWRGSGSVRNAGTVDRIGM